MSIYTGINGVNKNWSSLKIGVNGVVKTANNGFIGINGVSKSFYTHKAEDIVRFELTPKELTLAYDNVSMTMTKGTYNTFSAFSKSLTSLPYVTAAIVYGSSCRHVQGIPSSYTPTTPDSKHIEITLGGTTSNINLEVGITGKIYAIFPDGYKADFESLVDNGIITSMGNWITVDTTKYDSAYSSSCSFSGTCRLYGRIQALGPGRNITSESNTSSAKYGFRFNIQITNYKRATILMQLANTLKINNSIERPIIIVDGSK